MSLIYRIQDLCSENNTTLIGLEREVGLGRGTIRNWEKSSPSIDKLQKIADYFKVSLDYLVFGYDRKWLANILKLVRGQRSFTQFVNETDVDADELHELCAGTSNKQPSLDTLIKIIAANPYPIPEQGDILEAAGYNRTEIPPVFKNISTASSNDTLSIKIDLSQESKDLQLEIAKIILQEPSMAEIIKKLNDFPPEKRDIIFNLIKTM